MAAFGVSAVQLDDSGQITRARMLRPDGAGQNWP